MNKKFQLVFGIISSTAIALVISKVATGSLNPVEVFRGTSLLLKIVVGFLGFSVLFSLIGLFSLRIFGDRRCSRDGHSLASFTDEFGMPVKCPFCNNWYHFKCLKAKGGSLTTGCRQGACPTAVSELDILNEFDAANRRY